MTCEETLEMVGMTMFLYTLVSYLVAHVEAVAVRFVGAEQASAASVAAARPGEASASACSGGLRG